MRASGERISDQDACLIGPLTHVAATLVVTLERWANKGKKGLVRQFHKGTKSVLVIASFL